MAYRFTDILVKPIFVRVYIASHLYTSEGNCLAIVLHAIQPNWLLGVKGRKIGFAAYFFLLGGEK